MLLVCYINYQDRTIVMGNYIFNTVDQITSLQDLRHKYNGCKSAEYQRAKGRGTEASAHPSTQTDVQWNELYSTEESHDFHQDLHTYGLYAICCDDV